MKLSQPKAQVETIIQNLKKEEKNLTYFIHKNGPLITVNDVVYFKRSIKKSIACGKWMVIVNVENVAFRHNYSQ